MSSPETFLAFAAIMLIIALIGVAIDWFGTPLRHRKFIPKAYKFPDERLFRSDVFSSARRIDIETRAEHLEGSNYRDVIAVTEPEHVQIESSANEEFNEAIVDISESSKGEVRLPAKSSAGEETIDRGSELMIGAESESAKVVRNLNLKPQLPVYDCGDGRPVMIFTTSRKVALSLHPQQCVLDFGKMLVCHLGP